MPLTRRQWLRASKRFCRWAPHQIPIGALCRTSSPDSASSAVVVRRTGGGACCACRRSARHCMMRRLWRGCTSHEGGTKTRSLFLPGLLCLLGESTYATSGRPLRPETEAIHPRWRCVRWFGPPTDEHQRLTCNFVPTCSPCLQDTTQSEVVCSRLVTPIMQRSPSPPQQLNLSYCQMGDIGTAVLADALQADCAVRSLWLCGNAISAAGAQKLALMVRPHSIIVPADRLQGTAYVSNRPP